MQARRPMPAAPPWHTSRGAISAGAVRSDNRRRIVLCGSQPRAPGLVRQPTAAPPLALVAVAASRRTLTGGVGNRGDDQRPGTARH